MANNKPRDFVTMHIPGVFPNSNSKEMHHIIESLGLGEIAYITQAVVYYPGTTNRMCDSYTVYFEKWTPYGNGACIRQKLQNGERVKIYNDKNEYLWTVTCPLCQRRCQRNKANEKPIRYKTPRWTSTRDKSLASMRRLIIK